LKVDYGAEKMKRVLIWMIIVLILVGCSPVVEKPTDGIEQPASEGESALNTAVPLTSQPEELPVESQPPVPVPVEVEQTAVSEPEPTVELQQADPSSVDLRLITPQPAKGGELIIQPVPGVPGEPGENPELVAAVIADLSERLGIDESEISLNKIVETQWRDSSLGCPQPNMNYLQVITPGFQIVLTANAQLHYYHTRDTTFFVYCQNTNPAVLPDVPPPSFDK
jgi:hypothetical protein